MHHILLKHGQNCHNLQNVFVSYNLESKVYKLIVLKFEKLIMNWNVIFNEEP
jgi:hypothetical protein